MGEDEVGEMSGGTHDDEDGVADGGEDGGMDGEIDGGTWSLSHDCN